MEFEDRNFKLWIWRMGTGWRLPIFKWLLVCIERFYGKESKSLWKEDDEKNILWWSDLSLIFTKNCKNSFIFRISDYATASTSDSVLIIGGYTGVYQQKLSTIAEYKDGNWENVGNLAQARYAHGAITSGSISMVVGGEPNSGSTLVYIWSSDSELSDSVISIF